MGRRKDYIPTRQKEFFTWQDNLVSRVVLKAAVWLIAAGKVTALSTAQGIWVPLYNAIKVKQNRTTKQVDAHKVGLKVYKKALRTFVKENLVNNTAISHDDKKALGINPGREGIGHRPAIDTAPNVMLKAKGGLEIQFECRVENDSSRPSMHQHADVIEFRMKVSPVGMDGKAPGGVMPPAGQLPPASYREAPEVSVSTKARFVKNLEDPALAGSWLYVFARYKNNNNDRKSGPWSEVAHVRIS